jgi:hypothetical protein
MFNNNPDFYPTPQSLINKMLLKIDFKTIQTVLEPSAGDGRLIEAIKNKFKYAHSSYYNQEAKWDIDAIELDDNLQHILKGKGYRVVHNDFLTFHSYKSYDAIIANFPFSEGDKHLLKALDMQQYGGQIVCLINAETLHNPYTNTRKDLLRQLEDYNAEIEYIPNAFYDADRKTDVEVALIYVNIPKLEDDSIILENLRQQEQFREESNYNYSKQLVNADFIKGIVEQYNFEVKAGLKLIAEYEALKPMMINTFDPESYNKEPILKLSLEREDKDHNCSLQNSYVKKVREKYWWALFNNKQFMGLFTTNLRRKYIDKINELKDYDFSLYNIYTIRIQLSKEMVKGVEDTIVTLFDEFSYQSSWNPEFGNNIHYYNGWSTNKCWKVNDKKVIIRLNAYGSWSERYNPTDYHVLEKLSDIEKVFNYLQTGTGIEVNEIDMKDAFKFAEQYGETKKIETTYFLCTFYKKGTAHLEWKYQDLVHRFNIFGSQSKNWLPPGYGKKSYNEMDEEEKRVVDEFEGELSYKKVMNNPDKYILETSQLLMLA